MINDSYTLFSKVYDALTDDVEYEKRCEFLEKIFSKHLLNKPELICDLGCGTGSVCTILSKKGYDMIGVDSSEEMLICAQEKNKDGKILYLNQDMTDFELYGTVDVFLSMLDSVNYLTEDDDFETCLNLCKNYLNPGGVFIFDVNTLYKYENVLSDNTFVFEKDNIFYTWENEKDSDFHIFNLNFFVKNSSGSYDRFTEQHFQRYYSDKEIREKIKNSGLILEAVYPDLSLGKIKDNEQRLFYVVKKPL